MPKRRKDTTLRHQDCHARLEFSFIYFLRGGGGGGGRECDNTRLQSTRKINGKNFIIQSKFKMLTSHSFLLQICTSEKVTTMYDGKQ